MANIITLQAQLESVRDTKDRSCKMMFETQELTNEEFSELRNIRGELGWLAFGLNPINEADIPKAPAEVHKKSYSQRLRAVIYRLWEKEQSQLDFDIYYNAKMEGIITKIKNLL